MKARKSRASEVDVPRLTEAMYKARLTLKRYRDEMRETVRQMVGRHWSDQGTAETVPVNLINMYVGIMARKLVAQNPRVMLSTWNKNMKPAVKAMEPWLNREMENMNFAKTMQRVVTAGLFSVGFTKVCLATPAVAGHKNWSLTPGTAFADEVLLDDMVWDIHARSFEEVGFIGHRYRVPLDLVKDSKLYTKARLKLEASDDPQFNKEGDERIGVLGRDFYSNREEYEDFVDLWEIYMPRHRLLITLADDAVGVVGGGTISTDPLRVVDWVGPDSGPFEVLGFGDVPGNAMPTAPLQNLRDLHDPANNIWRKLIRQAQRMKQNLLVGGGATEDAERINRTSDGESTQVNNADQIQERSWSLPNPQLFEMGNKLIEMFKEQGGNLDAVGGLNPQSKTLGQDQMLTQSASSIVAAMQETCVTHARKVLRKILWYAWYHPKNVIQSEFAPNGDKQYAINRFVHPANSQDPRAMVKRTGRLADMDLQIDPYSMQPQTPQSQMQALDNVMAQVLVPLAPVLQAQGIVPDMNYYLQLKAKYLNLPELPQILSIGAPQQPQGSGGPDGPGMPAQTNRTYTRVSQGNETTANKDAESSQRMRGSIGPASQNGTVNR